MLGQRSGLGLGQKAQDIVFMHSGIKFGLKIDDFQVACIAVLHCRTTALVIYLLTYTWLIRKSDNCFKSEVTTKLTMSQLIHTKLTMSLITTYVTPGACADRKLFPQGPLSEDTVTSRAIIADCATTSQRRFPYIGR